jgi:hypothetical protein
MTYPLTYQSYQRNAVYSAPIIVNSMLTPPVSSSSFFVALASSASASLAAILRSGVFWGKFMTPFTVGFSAISSPVCQSPQSKARFVNLLFGQKDALGRPAEVNPGGYGLCSNPEFFRPLRYSEIFPAKRNSLVSSSVALLFTSCGPTAIFRAIRAIVVNSVNRVVFTWLFPHIGKKVLKFLPSFANINPSASVVVKKLVFRVAAPASHTTPSAVGVRMRKAVGSSSGIKFVRPLGGKLSPETPTRFYFGGIYVGFSSLFNMPTRALIIGVAICRTVFNKFQQHDISPLRRLCHTMGV